MGDATFVKATKEVNEKYPNIGSHANYRVLPYTMQNKYSRAEERVSLKTIVCENEYLEATFLPEYGGRLYSLFHKKYQRQLLHVNPVFQPANLAIRNAWFSGGIEWNIGHFGHSCLTCESVFFGICTDKNNKQFLRLYEYERMRKIFYQIDFHLPEGKDILTSYTRIINPYDEPTSLYYWCNIAVDHKRNARVFSEDTEVIYIQPEIEPNGKMLNTFACGTLPHLEPLEGDVSYVGNFPRANEYFYQNKEHVKFPWEAVAYDDGLVFYECSTQPLRYRKMFCWGEHRGGEKWQEYLSRGKGEKYFEVQAGLSPTQLHAGLLQAKSEVSFMQVFGGLVVEEIDKAYQDLHTSTDYVKERIFSANKAQYLQELERTLQKNSEQHVDELLAHGRGWAHVECMRMQKMGEEHESLASMSFPAASLDKAQKFWVELLMRYARGGRDAFEDMPQFDVEVDVVSYMIDSNWQAILEHARSHDEKNKAWYNLQLALVHYENGDVKQALEILEHECLGNSASMILRTLGAMYAKVGETDKALHCYEKAYAVVEREQKLKVKEELVCEYFQLLYDAKHYEKLWHYYESMLRAGEDIREEVKVLVAGCAFELQKWTELEAFFTMKLERIREGDTALCELWFKKQAHDLGNANLNEVRKRYKPPENIDFRLVY